MSEEELQCEVRRLGRVVKRAYNMALTQMDLPTATILAGKLGDDDVTERHHTLFQDIQDAVRELFTAMDEPSPAERFNPVRTINPRLTAARKVLADLVQGPPWVPSNNTKEQ